MLGGKRKDDDGDSVGPTVKLPAFKEKGCSPPLVVTVAVAYTAAWGHLALVVLRADCVSKPMRWFPWVCLENSWENS